jgi:hypothetical protein
LPHSAQNLRPLLTVPQAEQVHSLELEFAEGFGAPQSAQNLPLLTVPHFKQVHSSAAEGFGLPHSAQNLPALPSCPQCSHFQPELCGLC